MEGVTYINRDTSSPVSKWGRCTRRWGKRCWECRLFRMFWATIMMELDPIDRSWKSESWEVAVTTSAHRAVRVESVDSPVRLACKLEDPSCSTTKGLPHYTQSRTGNSAVTTKDQWYSVLYWARKTMGSSESKFSPPIVEERISKEIGKRKLNPNIPKRSRRSWVGRYCSSKLGLSYSGTNGGSQQVSVTSVNCGLSINQVGRAF